MFQAGQYTVKFKRRWHHYLIGGTHGRYDTICEMYFPNMEAPCRTGKAKLHPDDSPDKVIGKKIALENALSSSVMGKKSRTVVWKAFWLWVSTWSVGYTFLYGKRSEIKTAQDQS